jgi:polyhydroxybutyrate depolymerase
MSKTMTSLSKKSGRVWIILSMALGIPLFLILSFFAAFSIANKTTGQILSSGEERDYLLYVPESYDLSTPAPLIIVIHGFAQWPAHQAYVTEWNELADEEGFIVLYPSGTEYPKRWRAGGDTQGDGTLSIDTQFIADLIDMLQQQYNIDSSRIYANGLSNGGGMSFLLSCELSERIAAIGTVAGAYLYPFEECTRERSVPLIVFHGTADPIVPYLGGPSGSFDIPFPNIPAWVKGYAGLNQCLTEPEILPSSGNDISGKRYTSCKDNAEVVFYSIAGGGHTWPGGNPIPEIIAGRTSKSIDATRMMWEFFQAHPLMSHE